MAAQGQQQRMTTEAVAAAAPVAAPSMLPDAAYRLQQHPGKQSAHGMSNASAMTSYLFGASNDPGDHAWSDSAHGRAVIRFFSRGIVGAAFFTLGGHYAEKWMKNYEPEAWQGLGKAPLLQSIAKGIDAGPGKIISHLFGPGAVRFRTHNAFTEHAAQTGINLGRSLGAEVTMVTFDFFSASIGDALTRNIIQGIDPDVRQPWFVDDQGKSTTWAKGHFDARRFVKAMGETGWRIFSKNAMEDWAAALPYVYQMKWQRQLISNIGDKTNPHALQLGSLRGAGFKRTADNSTNGACANVDAHGVIGSGYQWAGALDLHFRFIGYNWYTLMYREGYDAIARVFSHWRKNGYQMTMPSLDNPISSALHLVTDTVRYVTKSLIKANLYMQPAVIPFWLIRVPQTKWRGVYRVENPLTGKFESLRTQSGAAYPRAQLLNHDPNAWPPAAYVSNGKYGQFTQELFQHSPEAGNPGFIKNVTNPYAGGIYRNGFDKLLNFFGGASYQAGTLLTKAVDSVLPINQNDPNSGNLTRRIYSGMKGDLANLPLAREKLLRRGMDAAISYYPYMWLKAETALRVDDRKSSEAVGKMDRAIYDMIDNAARLRLADTWQAMKNIGHLAVREEKSLVSREGNHHHHLKEEAMAAAEKALSEAVALPKTQVQTGSIQQISPSAPVAANDGAQPAQRTDDSAVQRLMATLPAANDGAVNDGSTVGASAKRAASHAAMYHAGKVPVSSWSQSVRAEDAASNDRNASVRVGAGG